MTALAESRDGEIYWRELEKDKNPRRRRVYDVARCQVFEWKHDVGRERTEGVGDKDAPQIEALDHAQVDDELKDEVDGPRCYQPQAH